MEEREQENQNINEETNVDLSIQTVLDMVCGESGIPYQKAKCICSIGNVLVKNMDFENGRQLSIFDTNKAIIRIQRRGKYVFVCFDFQTTSSADMRQFFHILDNYGKFQEELANSDTDMITNVAELVPYAFPNITLSLSNPIFWGYQAPNPTATISQIHVVYEAERVQILADNIDFVKEKEKAIAEARAEESSLDQEIFFLDKEIEEINKSAALELIKENSQNVEDFSSDEALLK